MMKTKDLFGRAEQAVNNGTTKDCDELIRQLDALVQSEAAERAATAPPGQTADYRGDGATVLVKTEPGPRWAASADAGDHAEAARLEQLHNVLAHRHHRAATLRQQLQARRTVAVQEERRASAPGELRAMANALPAILDRTESALQEAQDALAELERWRLDAVAFHRLLPADAAVLDPQTFRRLGLALRHRVVEEDTRTLFGLHGGARTIPGLFASQDLARDTVRLLGPAPESLFDKMRKRLQGEYPAVAEAAERSARSEFNEVRLAKIAAGDIDV